jgi:putative oxidoreductase
MDRVLRLLFPLRPDLPLPSELLLLAARAFTGLGIAFAHGIHKLPPTERFVSGVAEMGFPAPQLFSWLAGFSEFGGGLLLVAGLLVRPAAFLVACTVSVAAFVRKAGQPFDARELALLYLALVAILAATGGGRFSLDRLVARWRAGRQG